MDAWCRHSVCVAVSAAVNLVYRDCIITPEQQVVLAGYCAVEAEHTPSSVPVKSETEEEVFPADVPWHLICTQSKPHNVVVDAVVVVGFTLV